MGEKRKQWEKIVMSGAAPPSYFNLTEDDEIALHKLEAKPTCITESDHCRMKEQHKKENMQHSEHCQKRRWRLLSKRLNEKKMLV